MGDRDSGRKDSNGPAADRKYSAHTTRRQDRPGANYRPRANDRRDGGRRRPGPEGQERTEDFRSQDPALDEDAVATDLDQSARAKLRTLSKGSAERVARHLVMAGRLLHENPESAYEHAQAALRRAGRVDVVREAAALTAYATSRYAEALREVRTVRRLSGLDNLRAIEADCERGLGRPERALTIARQAPSREMTSADQVELAIVASGARLDMNQPEAALLELEVPVVREATDAEILKRVAVARAGILRAQGKEDQAQQLEAPYAADEDDITIVSLDTSEPEATGDEAGTGE